MTIEKKSFDFLQLPPSERTQIIQELLINVMEQTWGGITFEGLSKLLIPTKNALFCGIELYYLDGALAGFTQLKLLEVEVAGKKELMMRALASAKPELRGKSVTDAFFMKNILRFYLKSIQRMQKLTFFFLSDTPVSYYGTARYAYEIHPSPTKTVTNEVKEKLAIFAHAIGLEVNPENPLTAFIPESFEDKEKENISWKKLNSPFVKFYFEVCPNYGAGESLMVFIPVSMKNMILSYSKFALNKLSKMFRLSRKSTRQEYREQEVAVTVHEEQLFEEGLHETTHSLASFASLPALDAFPPSSEHLTQTAPAQPSETYLIAMSQQDLPQT